jgi:predicted nucleic acid-binding protein
MTNYILDACALISLLNREAGADELAALYVEAANGRAELIINKLNLLEVYHGYRLADGESFAEEQLAAIKNSHIRIIDVISDDLLRQASKVRVTHKQLALTDTFAVAQALLSGGVLVSCDHHSLDIVDMTGTVEILWMR